MARGSSHCVLGHSELQCCSKGLLSLAGLLHVLLWADTAALVTGTRCCQGTLGLMVLLWLGPCTSTPCCTQGTTTHPHGGEGQARAVAEAGKAALLPIHPHSQWEHPTSPPSPSLVGVPMPEPPSHHTVWPPSPREVCHCTEETSARGTVLPPALVPLAQKGFPMVRRVSSPLREPSPGTLLLPSRPLCQPPLASTAMASE